MLITSIVVPKSHDKGERASLTPISAEVGRLLDIARRKYEAILGEMKSERTFNTWLFQEIFTSIERYGRGYTGLDSSFILFHRLNRQFYYKFTPYVKAIKDLKREDLLYQAEMISNYIDFIDVRDLPTVLSLLLPKTAFLINSKIDGEKLMVSINQIADVKEDKFRVMVDYVVALLGGHLNLRVENVSGFHAVLVANGVEIEKRAKDKVITIPVSESVVETRDRLMRKFNITSESFKSVFSSLALSQAIRIFSFTGEERISQIFEVFLDFSDAGYCLLPCQAPEYPLLHMNSASDISRLIALMESIYPGVRILQDHKDVLMSFPFSIDTECPQISEFLKELVGESNLKEKVICRGNIVTLKMI